MEVLFLCGIYPQPYKEEIFKNSKKGYQFAAQNLQEAIVEGFVQNGVNLSIVTAPFLSTFPLGYRKPRINYNPTVFNNTVPTVCASFLNVPFFQNVLNSLEMDVFNWCESNNTEKKHIIVYSLQANLMKVAIKAKNKFKNAQLSIIIPDLPEFMGSNYLHTALGIKKRQTQYIYENISFFDKFILLSEAMALPLKLEDNSYIVVEGIFNAHSLKAEVNEKEGITKTILYTGALSTKYGIDTLLAAFVAIPNKEYRLIICGDGEAKELIKEKAIEDDRIKYLGKVSHLKVLKLQKEADLLVNPRTPEGEYTNYSFPSKTMEYLASGTPVLMYRLPGIPSEYFDYCYVLDDTSINALTKKILEICSTPLEDKILKGQQATSFILEQKNAQSQVKKIIELISRT